MTEKLRRHSLRYFLQPFKIKQDLCSFFFPRKIHHQKLIARVKVLYQNILSSLRSRGTFFASRQQDSAQNLQENYIIRMQIKAVPTETCIEISISNQHLKNCACKLFSNHSTNILNWKLCVFEVSVQTVNCEQTKPNCQLSLLYM